MMHILKKPSWFIPEHEATDELIYKSRRDLMKLGIAGAASLALPTQGFSGTSPYKALKHTKSGIYTGSGLDITDYDNASTYTNFYEFSLEKKVPAKLAHTLKPEPWTIEITGEVEKSFTLDINDVFNSFPLEERIYRFRCVEAWSMVVPWVGFQLSYLLKKAGLTSKSKYVSFVTKHDPSMFPEQKGSSLFGNIPFPYREGLRIDEAMNPLTLITVGMYGKRLPNQNGAPLRLIVPWKYGFKSIKSIVKIEVTEHQPISTWNRMNKREYGFYANVNPKVSHPRWSQKRERVLGKFFKQETLKFNGYDKEVASMYKDMDLKKFI